MANQKDFKVKNGLIVGGNSSITGNLTVTGTVNGRSQLVDSAEVIKLIESTFDSDNTLSLVDSDYVTQRSYAHHYYVKAAEAISAGEVVMFGGVQGDHILAKVADFDAVGFIPEWIMGVANTSIALNAWGRVTATGRLEGIDTSSFSNGDLLYADPSNDGGFTTTKPSPPNHAILVAAVLKSAAGTSGIIQVRLTHKPDTDEVPEGSSNLYYTTSRADSDARNAISVTDAGGAGSLSYSNGVITYTGPTNSDFLDSSTVTGVISSSYIQSNQTTYNTSDFTDSAYVTGLPVSTFTNDTNYLDSSTVTGVISASYIQANQTTYNTSNFVDSSYVSTQINNLIDGAPGTLDTLNEIAAALNDDDSAYATLVNLIGDKDSDFVKSAANQTWIQSQQITYNTSDFTDSAYVTSVLPTYGTDYVDSAYVTSVLPTYGNDYVDSAFVSGKSIALSIALG